MRVFNWIYAKGKINKLNNNFNIIIKKDKQPEKVIKVTPEDGRFSDDDEGGGGDDSNKQSKQHQQQQQQPKMADRSKSPLDFQEPSTKAIQQQNINVNQSVEEEYRELVKQIEQYENKIDNFTG